MFDSLKSFESTMHFQLPKTLDHWPWLRILNVHYDQIKHDSRLWLEGFKPFSPEIQDAFNKCEFGMYNSSPSCRQFMPLLISMMMIICLSIVSFVGVSIF